MAMLAEPRRRQRFSVDPRGMNWSNDENKFGQKLMEKFGWTKGRGLGANENGMTEHIKISAKSDQRGVGCSKKHDDNWIAHQDDFNSLLASLNDQNSNDTVASPSKDMVEVLSLEQKSKTTSKRVHYTKFTRGKDLSKAGSHDMDCIFGRRKSKSAPDTPQDMSENNSDAEEASRAGDTDTQHGVTTISTGTSVQEYFAQKMAELQKSRAAALARDTESQSTPGSSNCPSPSPVDGPSPDDTEQPRDKSSKKKKSKKRKYKEEIENVEETNEEEVQESEPSHKKKKKSKKSKKGDDELVASDSNEASPPASPVLSVEHSIEDPTVANQDVDTPDTEGVVKKKKKKSKKRKERDTTPSGKNDTELAPDACGGSSQDGEGNRISETSKDCSQDGEGKRTSEASKDSSQDDIKSANCDSLEGGFKGSNIGEVKGYAGGIRLKPDGMKKKKTKKSKRKSQRNCSSEKSFVNRVWFL